MLASKKVAKILEQGLGVKRIAMVIEGMETDHVHIKLYLLHGIKNKLIKRWVKEKVWFDKYEGYISTQRGGMVDIAELKKLAEKIKNKAKI